MAKAKSLLIVFLFFVANSVFAECTVFAGCAECDKYIEDFFCDDFTKVRKEFAYKSYPSAGTIGFYTGWSEDEENCAEIEIDHVVSIKEAFCRGLPRALWKNFANDRENHVEACSSINQSKGASGPEDFSDKADNDDGKEYTIINWDEYLYKYCTILKKYDLLKKGEGSGFLRDSVCS